MVRFLHFGYQGQPGGILKIPKIVFLVAALVVSVGQSQASPDTHTMWFEKLVSNAKTIKPGSLRGELLKLFWSDEGKGIEDPPSRFRLKGCRLIQMEVDFVKAGTFTAEKLHPKASDLVVSRVSPLQLQPSHGKVLLSENEHWLLAMIEDACALHGGMPRSALAKNFKADDGLNTVPASRYVHKDCNLVKVDVKFARASKAVPTQGAYANELTIESISAPYADMPVSD